MHRISPVNYKQHSCVEVREGSVISVGGIYWKSRKGTQGQVYVQHTWTCRLYSYLFNFTVFSKKTKLSVNCGFPARCVVYQPIAAAVVRIPLHLRTNTYPHPPNQNTPPPPHTHTQPHHPPPTHTHTSVSLSLSLVPSPLKRHTGGCAPLDMWARILTLETEDGHGCTLWWLNYRCGNRSG